MRHGAGIRNGQIWAVILFVKQCGRQPKATLQKAGGRCFQGPGAGGTPKIPMQHVDASEWHDAQGHTQKGLPTVEDARLQVHDRRLEAVKDLRRQ